MAVNKKRQLIPFFIFLIIPSLALFPIWLNPVSFFQRNSDIAGFALPLFTFFKDTIIATGKIPLWQNVFLSGYPLLGDPQSVLLYPFNYLAIFIDLPKFFTLYYLFHLFLAGFSVYYLGKQVVKLTNKAAILAGIIYSLCPKFIAHIEAGHLNLFASYSYIPVVLFFYFLLLKKPTPAKAVMFGFSMAMVYVLYITTFYYLLLILVGLSIYQMFRHDQTKNLRLLIFFGISSLFFSGFVLPELLASIELWPQLARNLLQYSDIAGVALAWRQYLSFLFDPLSVKIVHTEMVLYPGFLALILAGIGFSKKPLKEKILIGLIISGCFFYAVGPKTAFYLTLFKHLPGVSLFRIPSRMWFIVILIISLLAGFGLDQLFQKRKKIALALIILTLAEFIYLANIRLSIPVSLAVNTIPSKFYSKILESKSGYFRIYCTQQCLMYSIISGRNISMVDGYNPVQLRNYFWFYQKAAGFEFASYAPILPPYQTLVDKPQPDAARQGVLGIRYVITPFRLTDPNYQLEISINGLYLYRNNLEKPRVYLANKGEIIPLKVTSDQPGRVVVDIPTSSEGKVVLNEVYTKAWKVYLDDKKDNAEEENNIVIAASINKDNKKLVFLYEPLGIPYSWYILLITYIVSVLLMIRKRSFL